MEKKKQRIGFSKGRTEFIAARDEILNLCNTGVSKAIIYKKMCGDGKFTMHYNTFCYHLRKLEKENNHSKKSQGGNQNQKPQAQRANTLSVPERGSGSFIRPSDLADKPLI